MSEYFSENQFDGVWCNCSVTNWIIEEELPRIFEMIKAIVKALHMFRNFDELYAALPLDKCGYTADELTTASPDDMLEYYSKEQIEKYGVVGMEIEV